MGEHTIERLGAEAIDEAEPLWNALREHHAALNPEWGAPRDRAASWAIRRASYVDWLADARAFCLIARDPAGRAIGYTLVRHHGPEALWPTEQSGEIETLSVLPDARSAGVGAALLDAAKAELAAGGIEAVSLHVLHNNVDGLRFYRREGFETATVVVWADTAAPDAGAPPAA